MCCYSKQEQNKWKQTQQKPLSFEMKIHQNVSKMNQMCKYHIIMNKSSLKNPQKPPKDISKKYI